MGTKRTHTYNQKDTSEITRKESTENIIYTEYTEGKRAAENNE